MQVVRINTTPVKGTGLLQAGQVALETAGVHANRRFHFIDARGTMVNGKRAGKLVRLRTEYDADRNRLRMLFPDGRSIDERVRTSDEAVTTDFYGRPVHGNVVDGPWASAVSAFTGIDLRLVHISPETTGTDVHPVTLTSRATMEHVRSTAGGPAERWNDRFRMLFELDGLEPYEEDTWVDRSVEIGDAIVQVIGPVRRCVVTTHDPATGVRSFDTLDALRRARGERVRQLSAPTEHFPDGGPLLLGVYAVVERPGAVRKGSAVRVR